MQSHSSLLKDQKEKFMISQIKTLRHKKQTEKVSDRTKCSSVLFFMDPVILRKYSNHYIMRHPNGQNKYYLTNYLALVSPGTFTFSG